MYSLIKFFDDSYIYRDKEANSKIILWSNCLILILIFIFKYNSYEMKENCNNYCIYDYI